MSEMIASFLMGAVSAGFLCFMIGFVVGVRSMDE